MLAHEPSGGPYAYRDGELSCGPVSLRAVAERYGTPLYVYSANAIRDAYAELDGAFAGCAHRVCYSVKANPNLSVCRLIARLGAGADVTSGGELVRALRAGFAAESIVFAGVGKARQELRQALGARIGLFSVESEQELRTISEIASEVGVTAPVAIRINPDIDARTHRYITTGLASSKFGVPIANAEQLYALVEELPGTEAVGVGMHIGSQLTDLSPMLDAAERLADLAAGLMASGHRLRYFDVGGGFGIRYTDEAPDAPATVAARLCELSERLGLTLLTEPGRRLVGPAGVLLAQVVYTKRHGDRTFAIVDAGMNALIRPALYGAQHRIFPVRDGRPASTYDVVGPVCESSDVLARGVELPEVRPGDVLALLDAGAYGFSMASEYNGRPRPAEVMIDGADARLIRRRQSYEELMEPEILG